MLVTTQATRWVVDGAYMEIKAGTRVERPRTIEAACPDPHRCGLVFGAIQQAARNDITHFPDDAVVIFEPAEFCSQGFPVWQDASTSHPCTEDAGEDLTAVVVTLRDEYEEID